MAKDRFHRLKNILLRLSVLLSTKTFLPGKLKLWCLQFGLFPCTRWHAQSTLQPRGIIGLVQSGRAGFGLGDSWKARGKTALLERWQKVTIFVRKQRRGN